MRKMKIYFKAKSFTTIYLSKNNTQMHSIESSVQMNWTIHVRAKLKYNTSVI